jgi:hypothetical protein
LPERNSGCAPRRGKVQLEDVSESCTEEQIGVAAQETAARLLAALGGGGLAARFVRGYAEKHKRRALVAHPARHRELIERIGREALLAMSAKVERELSREFGGVAGRRPRRSGTRKVGGDDGHANHFRVEFYGELAEKLRWDRGELADFWRDLDLYTGAGRGPMTRRKKRGPRRSRKDRHLGAFADRCAFLLDSSLLERARRAAGRLHREIEREALRAFHAGFERAELRATAPRASLRRIKPRRARAGKRRKHRIARGKKGGRR